MARLVYGPTGVLVNVPDGQAGMLSDKGFAAPDNASSTARPASKAKSKAELIVEARTMGITVDAKARKSDIEALIREAGA